MWILVLHFRCRSCSSEWSFLSLYLLCSAMSTCWYKRPIIRTLLILVAVLFSHSVVSDYLQSYGLQHARLSCPSPSPRACSNWCHPTVSSSVVPFSSCLQSFPASGSFPMSQFFSLGGQSVGVSASSSTLPVNIQDWFPLGLTGWISLWFKGPSRVFSNTTVQSINSSVLSFLYGPILTSIYDYWKNHSFD